MSVCHLAEPVGGHDKTLACLPVRSIPHDLVKLPTGTFDPMRIDALTVYVDVFSGRLDKDGADRFKAEPDAG